MEVGGTKYNVGCVLITSLHFGNPIFGQLEKIMVEAESGSVLFKCKNLKGIKYEEHLNAYQVSLTEDVKYIWHKDLIDFHPLGIQRGFECNSTKSFVVLRYQVDFI